jgi:hypothetical protein
MPFLVLGMPFTELAIVLQGDKLYQAVAAIISKTGAVDYYRGVASLQERVEKLRRHPGEGATK